MQAMNSVLNVIGSTTQQIPLDDDNNVHQLIHNPHFDPSNPSSSSHHDFLQHMLLSNTWSDSDLIASNSDETCPPNSDNNNDNVGFSYDELLPSKLRVHHQINSYGGGLSAMPGGEGSVMQGLFNGFGGGSLHGIETNNSSSMNQTSQHFNQQGGNMGATGTAAGSTAMNRGQAGGSTPAQPKTRVRARRGQATDPHSIAERLRRERIAERMKALQELVPNANRTDKASMLDEIIDYLKFLQLQVKVLSVSRLGGAGATVAPFVANMPSQRGGGPGGGDGVQTNADGGSSNSKQTPSNNGGQTVTEHQVVKLMEEDMGSAMQYLQGKGLCLMPISLAAAISTSTCHSRNPHTVNGNNNHHPLLQSSGEGPSSPNMSALTVQSASNGIG